MQLTAPAYMMYPFLESVYYVCTRIYVYTRLHGDRYLRCVKTNEKPWYRRQPITLRDLAPAYDVSIFGDGYLCRYGYPSPKTDTSYAGVVSWVRLYMPKRHIEPVR